MGKQFVDGLYLNKVSDKAPDFVKASVSVHVEKMLAWLDKNMLLVNEKGYINLKGLESKDGQKRYFEVDTWKPRNDERDQASGNQPTPQYPDTLDDSETPF